MAAAQCGVLHACIGQVLQPVNVGAQAAQRIALHVVKCAVFQLGQAETHPCQRRAHLVRHRLGQHPLAFQQLLQLLGHVVEGIGQRPHQCGAGARRTRVQLAVAHAPRRLGQLRYVAPQPVDHHVHRQCHRHHQDQQQDRHAGHFAVLPPLIGQCFVQRPQHHRVVAVTDALKAAHVLQVDLHAAVVERRALAGRQRLPRLGQRHQAQGIGEISVEFAGQRRPLLTRGFGEAMLQQRVRAAHLGLQAGFGAVFQQGIPGPQAQHDQQQVGEQEADAVAQEVEGVAAHRRRRARHPHAERLNR